MPPRSKSVLARHNTSYQLQKVFRDGQYVHFVEVICANCNTVEELRQGPHTDTTDPAQVRKRMTTKGWAFDPYHKRGNLCPKCQKGEQVMPQKPTLVAVQPEVQMAQTPIQGPRTGLTTEERFKVRQLLDQHFDDKLGAYLNQYSDQRIGMELELPWKLVFDLREMAYGPIREDPRIAQIRNDMAALERGMSELRTKIAQLGTKP